MAERVIVITGASSGIGAAAAERLAADGAHVVLVARRAAQLAEVASRCGPAAVVMAADMTAREDVARVVRTAIAQCGHIDVWINNVGRGITRLPSALTDADVDDMMRVNVKAALYGMQEILPHFRERGAGHVINVSSMLGRIPLAPARSAYTAAKHFLNALTMMIRTEVQATHPGIQFSLVSPGVVYTDFGRNAVHGGPDSRELPGGQEPGAVADVIASVVRSRKPDVYTRPGSRAQVAEFYAGIGEDPEGAPAPPGPAPRRYTSLMTLEWHRESLPLWDEPKQLIVGGAPPGVFAVSASAPGAALPGDWWRVEEDGRVVGYGWMDYSWGDAEVLLAVDGARQAAGIGTFILDRLDEEASSRGLNYLYNVIPAGHPDKAGLRRWLLQRGFVGSLEGDLFKRTVHPRKPGA